MSIPAMLFSALRTLMCTLVPITLLLAMWTAPARPAGGDLVWSDRYDTGGVEATPDLGVWAYDAAP